MEGLTDKDAKDLQLIKDTMAQKAKDGDTGAAAAFAALLEAQTNRERLMGKVAGQGDWQSLLRPTQDPHDGRTDYVPEERGVINSL